MFNISLKLIIIIVTAYLLVLLGEATLTWTSPVLPKLHSNDSNVNPLSAPITSHQESLITSLSNIGTLMGTIPLSNLSNKIGRKPVLLAIAVFHIVSYATLAFAKHVELFYFARIIGGVSSSTCYVVLPIYIGEISENSYRGIMVASFVIFSSLGSLLSHILGTYLSIMWMNLTLAGIGIISLISIATIGVESPHYHLLKNNPKEAMKILKKIRGKNEEEIKKENENNMAEVVKNSSESLSSILKTLKQRYVIKSIILVLVIMVLGQFSGYIAFIANTQKIFAEAKIKSISASTCSIIVGTVPFFSVGISLYLVDKLGRKFLFLTTTTVAFLSVIALSVYFYIKNNTNLNYDSISWLPILSLVFFLAGYTNGFLSVFNVLCSEMFPSNIKFFLTSVFIVTGGVCGFLVTYFFSSIVESIGFAQTLWICAGFCFAAIVIVFFCLTETKGKSFSEIQRALKS